MKNTRQTGKKYMVTSKFRFTLFVAVLIICIVTATSSILGFNTVNSASYTQYTQVSVETGDTLWDIAKEYAPEDKDLRQVVYDICEVNDVSADNLQAGLKILVPVYS